MVAILLWQANLGCKVISRTPPSKNHHYFCRRDGKSWKGNTAERLTNSLSRRSPWAHWSKWFKTSYAKYSFIQTGPCPAEWFVVCRRKIVLRTYITWCKAPDNFTKEWPRLNSYYQSLPHPFRSFGKTTYDESITSDVLGYQGKSCSENNPNKMLQLSQTRSTILWTEKGWLGKRPPGSRQTPIYNRWSRQFWSVSRALYQKSCLKIWSHLCMHDHPRSAYWDCS